MMPLHCTQTYSHDGPPVYSYLYAEIDVVAKRKNKVPEPSSTEDIDHHVYAVLEQPSNQIQVPNLHTYTVILVLIKAMIISNVDHQHQ